MPASRSARRSEPKNQILFALDRTAEAAVELLHDGRRRRARGGRRRRLAGRARRTVVGVVAIPALGWYSNAPDPLNVLPPLFRDDVDVQADAHRREASTPPVFTCVSAIMSAPMATYVIWASW